MNPATQSEGALARTMRQVASAEAAIPEPVRAILRGVGQVFFQESALTGTCFVLGIALSSPLMALGGIVGSALGYATARFAKFDAGETAAGIFGFNSALVGIASFFFFQLGVASALLMLVGCVVAAFVTWLMRRHVPFPTYTTPFIVTTWGVYLVAKGVGAAATDAATGPLVPDIPTPFAIEATAHGVGQVMFQGSLWTGLLFLVGIALSEWRHALWVLLGAVVGMLVARFHVTLGADTIDPERLITRTQLDTIRLGLYGYNATLAPVALFLWRRTLIAPVLGMILAVYVTDFLPLAGLPALTAPFVLATWVVLLFGWLESRYLGWSRAGSVPGPTPDAT